jgi:hypothetical protein
VRGRINPALLIALTADPAVNLLYHSFWNLSRENMKKINKNIFHKNRKKCLTNAARYAIIKVQK